MPMLFCVGGGTLLESMTIGVPAVVFQQHIQAFAEFGLLMVAVGWHQNYRFEFLVKPPISTVIKSSEPVDGYGAIGGVLRQLYSCRGLFKLDVKTVYCCWCWRSASTAFTS